MKELPIQNNGNLLNFVGIIKNKIGFIGKIVPSRVESPKNRSFYFVTDVLCFDPFEADLRNGDWDEDEKDLRED